MLRWRDRLAELGQGQWKVRCFDYPYQLAGRRAPDRQPVLVEAHRTAFEAARANHSRVVLVGKSMGSRIGCHVAAEAMAGQREAPRALVCLGYPLVGANGAVRDQVLLDLNTPILFVQGTRDHLCPLDRLEETRARMRAPNELHVVEGGDHSLTLRSPRRARGRAGTDGPPPDRSDDAQETSDAQVLHVIGQFLARWAR
jgi:predicted alpha/beta-hydrolase family hydrolase